MAVKVSGKILCRGGPCFCRAPAFTISHLVLFYGLNNNCEQSFVISSTPCWKYVCIHQADHQYGHALRAINTCPIVMSFLALKTAMSRRFGNYSWEDSSPADPQTPLKLSTLESRPHHVYTHLSPSIGPCRRGGHGSSSSSNNFLIKSWLADPCTTVQSSTLQLYVPCLRKKLMLIITVRLHNLLRLARFAHLLALVLGIAPVVASGCRFLAFKLPH